MISILVIKVFLITILILFIIGTLIPIVKLCKKGLDSFGTHEGYSVLAKLSMLGVFFWISIIIMYLFFDYLFGFFWDINFLVNDLAIMVGLTLSIIGFIFTVLGTIKLGSNFRIKLPIEETGLITTGIYRLLRNPIVFGVHLFMIGTFFFVPNLIVLILTVFNLVTFDKKARDEEIFLLKRFGKSYEEYRNKIGRYTPFSLKLIRKKKAVKRI